MFIITNHERVITNYVSVAYYKLRQSVITNYDTFFYYKLRQSSYKLWQVLQIKTKLLQIRTEHAQTSEEQKDVLNCRVDHVKSKCQQGSLKQGTLKNLMT